MARGKGRRRHNKRVMRRDFAEGESYKRQRPADAERAQKWRPAVTESPLFEEYYKGQGVVPDGEWDAFIAALHRPLPLTFRINGAGRFAEQLRDRLREDFLAPFHDAIEEAKKVEERKGGKAGEEVTEEEKVEAGSTEDESKEAPSEEKDKATPTPPGSITLQGETVPPPRELSWYPDGLGWKFFFSRAQLRKEPTLRKLHEFLKVENEAGSITRQEEVSMVPPCFLDVRPGHRVLDTCAAPGSKTTQLLEALHAPPVPAGGPRGYVVANDADPQRCNLLVHQSKRLQSPCLVVTNAQAQLIPSLYDAQVDRTQGEEGGEGGSDAADGVDAAAPAADGVDAAASAASAASAARSAPRRSQRPRVYYDRILCDVPCCGDGTMRKAPEIWGRWTPGNGNGLHALQVKIALRACELLAVGGRLVYSTCTFNPVEDEAVVAEVLRCTRGAIELVDASGDLPQLVRSPGLRRWRIRDDRAWHETWAGDGEHGSKLSKSMFPDERSDGYPLERCMRFLPHTQDTGGFFVAVLRKVAAMDKADEPETEATARIEKKEAKEAEKEEEGEEEKAEEKKPETEGEEEKPEEEKPETEGEEEKPEEEKPETKGEEKKPETEVEKKPEGKKPAEIASTETTSAPATPVPVAPSTAPASTSAAAPPTPLAIPFSAWKAHRALLEARSATRRPGLADPVIPYTNESMIATIKAFYGLPEDCPITANLVTRNFDDSPKRLYYVAPDLARFIVNDPKESLKIFHVGVKMFERYGTRQERAPNACPYRICQEGLATLLPYLTKQVFRPPLEEIRSLLRERVVFLPKELFSNLDRWTEDGQKIEEEGTEEGKDKGEEIAEAAEDGEPEPANAEDAEPTDAEEAKPAAPSAEPGGKPKNLRELSDPRTIAELGKVQFGCCVALPNPTEAEALGLANDDEGIAAPAAAICWRGRCRFQVLMSVGESGMIANGIEDAMRRKGIVYDQTRGKKKGNQNAQQ